ncbi:MAG TPA: hypothetical protein VGE63_00605 [Candidatus Paceibacterota bacterium]
MSHEFSHKKAIVFGYRNYGEKDRYYNLLIEDDGLRYVRVQGVRDVKSKHRNLLGLFACPTITYIHGREYRLIGIQEDEYLATTEELVFAFSFIANITRVVEFDEAEHKGLYHLIREIHDEISQHPAVPRTKLLVYIASTILNFIGYGDEKHEHMPLEQVILTYETIHTKVRAMVYEHRELSFLNEYLDIV